MHNDEHREAQLDKTVPKLPAPTGRLPWWTLQDFFKVISSPSQAVAQNLYN